MNLRTIAHPFVILAWALLAALAAPPALAGPFLTDTTRVSQGTATEVSIRGIPGESFKITYTDASGAVKTKTVTLTNLLAQRTTVPAKAGTPIKIENLSQPGEPAQNYTAQRFDPTQESAVTALVLDPGSTLTAFGQTVALRGGFSTIATAVDYDLASPGMGELSGYVPSSFFDVFTELDGFPLEMHLTPPGSPFGLNVGSTWDADMPDTGLGVPFTQQLNGFLTWMGNVIPFVGHVTGQVTFFSDNVETIAGSIVLDNIGTGTFSASGRTTIPTPASITLAALALLALGGRRSRRS